jgi:hypothetical protein
MDLVARPTQLILITSIARRFHGGFIKSLVTHPSLARALIAQQESQSLPDPPERET